jgi:hypothetical protein
MRAAATVFLLIVAGGGTVLAYDEAALLKGRTAAAALNETLRTRMGRSLKESGPRSAMSVCAYQAQALAEEVGKNEGVKVKRTSLKLRNPANAPDDYEKQLLARLSAEAREGNLSDEYMDERRELGRKVVRYAKPLVVGAFCVTCHGRAEEIPEDVRKALETRYPEDAATGYREGDFLGIVSVIIPTD